MSFLNCILPDLKGLCRWDKTKQVNEANSLLMVVPEVSMKPRETARISRTLRMIAAPWLARPDRDHGRER